MTTTAFTLAVISPELAREENLASKVFVIAVAPILGASIASLLLALWRTLRGGPPFPTQPGHWLLVAVGIIAGTFMVLMAIGRMLPSPSPAMESFEFFFAVFIVIAAIVSAILLAIAAINDQLPLHWRLALRVVAASIGLIFACGCMMPLHGPASWAAPLAITIYLSGPGAVVSAAAADTVTGTRYDVFHWAGVATIPLMFGLPWVMFFFG
jgi:hypothetical protein